MMTNLINSYGISQTVAFRFIHFRILELVYGSRGESVQLCLYFIEDKEKTGPEVLDDLFKIIQLVIKARLES